MDQVCAALPLYSVLQLINNRDTMISDTPTAYTHMTVSKKSTTDAKCYCATVGKVSGSYLNATYQGEWKSNSGSPAWSGWVRIATVAPPQEYDLPLAEGVSVASYTPKYWLAGTGFGGIYGTIKFNAPPTAGQVVAALPVGYRPVSQIPICFQSGNAATYGWILPNGNVQLSAGNPPDWDTSDVIAIIATNYFVGL